MRRVADENECEVNQYGSVLSQVFCNLTELLSVSVCAGLFFFSIVGSLDAVVKFIHV